MVIFQSIISKVAVMLLIYLILNRALSNLRRRKKALIIFLIGISLSGLFFIAYIVDKNNPNNPFEDYIYFTYIASNIFFGSAFLLFGIKGTRKNDFIKQNYIKQKDYSPTSRVHYKKFLYLVFEYKNEYLLKKDKETYSGMNLRLKKGEFHDVEIGNLLKKYNAIESKVTEYGEYVSTKNKEIFYVYLINLDRSIDIKKCEYIYYSKIRFLEMSDFDKEIIYRVLIKEKINIEV